MHIRKQDEKIQEARAEAALSESRLAETRREVVKPLRERGVDDQFAEIIRRSLREGHGPA